MILMMRTDSPTAELYLYESNQEVARNVWEAHRTLARDLLQRCGALCESASSNLSDVTAIIIYKGPGSFTGLRIGCTVANTLAYGQSIPIVGVSGDAWKSEGLTRLDDGHDDKSVIPDYGAEPRITIQQK